MSDILTLFQTTALLVVMLFFVLFLIIFVIGLAEGKIIVDPIYSRLQSFLDWFAPVKKPKKEAETESEKL
jgi:hypothetical protein